MMIGNRAWHGQDLVPAKLPVFCLNLFVRIMIWMTRNRAISWIGSKVIVPTRDASIVMNICMEFTSPLLLEPYLNKFLSCAYVLAVDFEGGLNNVYIRHIPSSKISMFSPKLLGPTPMEASMVLHYTTQSPKSWLCPLDLVWIQHYVMCYNQPQVHYNLPPARVGCNVLRNPLTLIVLWFVSLPQYYIGLHNYVMNTVKWCYLHSLNRFQ